MQPRPGTELRVALLAVPESTPATLYGLFEVFSSVGRTWEMLTGEPADCRTIAPRIVARSTEAFVSPVGLPIAPQDELGTADVVIVTDLSFTPDFDPRGNWGTEAQWLRGLHEDGAMICSVCTGSVLLAEAGLLDGEIATTHWSATDLMERWYPDVRLAPERILVPADEGNRIVTSGGASSWEDLALYLIAQYCGAPEAVRIAKIFLLGERAEGQLPFAGACKPRRHEDAIIAEAQSWVAENYHDDNPVARMSARSGLSERTFKRRFRAATGYNPIDYVQTLRIEEAKHLLETSDLPTDTIAAEVGYTDRTFFRRLFKRRTGITPARYRQKFSTIGRVDARQASTR